MQDTVSNDLAADDAATGETPWHFWAVAIVSLLWNSFGVYDYVMTETRNAAYMAQLNAEQLAYIESYPGVMVGFWALGVWGALAGSVLLLLRSRRAVTAFAASLVGLAVSTLYQWVGGTPESMRGGAMIAMQLVIWASLLFFLWYSMKMRDAGVLR